MIYNTRSSSPGTSPLNVPLHCCSVDPLARIVIFLALSCLLQPSDWMRWTFEVRWVALVEAGPSLANNHLELLQ